MMSHLQDSIGANLLQNPLAIIGREISGVTILDLLGRGAMGLVYTAFQKSLKRKVALKLYPKLEDTAKSLNRLRDEAQVVAVLNHPHIAPVFDLGETEEFLFIVMQLIDGEDLGSMIARHLLHPIPSRRLIPKILSLNIILGVLDALSYAHSQQVVHQDVKPQNVLIERGTNRPFLVDFGIARTILTEHGKSKLVLGTPVYMAPEQARGEETDRRADIYSVGIMLWEIFAGKLPVSTTTTEKLIGLKIYKPDQIFGRKPSESTMSIDSELERIILKATAVDLVKRYQSCTEFSSDLTAYVKKQDCSEM